VKVTGFDHITIDLTIYTAYIMATSPQSADTKGMPSCSSSSLEAELARGLQLTAELTSYSKGKTNSTSSSSGNESPSSTNSSPVDSRQAALPNKAGISILFDADLQYAPPSETDEEGSTLQKCHLPACTQIEDRASIRLSSCAQCKVARYCGRAHQVLDWKQGHKHECAQWKTLMAMKASSREADEPLPTAGGNKTNASKAQIPTEVEAPSLQTAEFPDVESANESGSLKSTRTDEKHGSTLTASSAASEAAVSPRPVLSPSFSTLDKKDVASKLLCKLRLHLGPYTLAHYDRQGRGFGFLQSTATAGELFLSRPINRLGHPVQRHVLLHYLTWGEFVSVVLEALAAYDPEVEYVAVVKLRCGFLGVFRVPLVPHAAACRRLAEDYAWAERASVTLELD